ncbi:hypothetical protein [Streptomyces corynorhini]|uniref:Uncharacterized protein n=1 Tax=Streptomyces corynorhini TaxID=2282652 RepID=A0A370B514_9ACTN|nr:hypothetical protein [Streptomyces corynorhini]RDG35184.1 hypothetical protein DVH02_26675 [Streptomyces corynorhini]
MPRRLRACDVSRQLGDAGHTRAHKDQDGEWEYGYRCAEHGPRLVHVTHEGAGQDHYLNLYRLALQNLGYAVGPEQPDRGRRRLAVTLP